MPHVLAVRHVPHEDLGTLKASLAAAGLEPRYVDLFDEQSSDRQLGDAAGLIVLGGPMNVDQTDAFPFLRTSLALIEQALAAERPILGICLGSQMLAKALGSTVRAQGFQEIGWYDLELTDAATGDWLFGGLPRKQRVFQWHGDTFDLPRGATHLARGDACPQQAFRYGRNAYAVQFHVEVTGQDIAAWLDEPENACQVESLDNIDADAIRRQIPAELPGLHALGGLIGERFARLCQQA